MNDVMFEGHAETSGNESHGEPSPPTAYSSDAEPVPAPAPPVYPFIARLAPFDRYLAFLHSLPESDKEALGKIEADSDLLKPVSEARMRGFLAYSIAIRTAANEMGSKP